MIVSENNKPDFAAFALLMKETDARLNADAKGHEDLYYGQNNESLETTVHTALTECAKGTPFEGSIALVSGKTFPDIVFRNKYFGVEVKSTNKNHWTSIGSSILESSRDKSVERIFLTFGKLHSPVQFLSRPYEQCMSGIAVTHAPRYKIDMTLRTGETIFDKMGVAYDDLRKKDNPVREVTTYLKEQMREGERLWWAEGGEPSYAPPVLRLWSNLSRQEKDRLTIAGYAFFPQTICGSGAVKYQDYALWLASHHSVIAANVRDLFSAGGQKTILTKYGNFEDMPAVLARVRDNIDRIAECISDANEAELITFWNVKRIEADRLRQWCDLVVDYAKDPKVRMLTATLLQCITATD